MIVSTEALVLNSKKYGDSGKIVTVFTKEDGKITLMVKGARSSKNRFGSALEPMSHIYISYYKKNKHSMQMLQKAELIRSFRKIQTGLERITCALSVLESVAQTQDEYEPNENLYKQMLSTLDLMNDTENSPQSLFLLFQLDLAVLMGVDIDLGGEIADDDLFPAFSIENGRLAEERNLQNENTYVFNIKALKSLQKISILPLELSIKMSIEEDSFKETVNFFMKYFSYHLDKYFIYRSFKLLSI